MTLKYGFKNRSLFLYDVIVFNYDINYNDSKFSFKCI